MNSENLIAIVLLSPFIGFLINGLRFNKKTPVLSGTIASIAMLISFISAIILFINLIQLPVDNRKLTFDFLNWFNIENFKINFSFVVDQISAIMILIITGVGFFIHLFSIGYMSHDPGVTKYFSYLNFFVFNMLILVLGDSLPVMFVGWEGVGLCSYLLIGFWYKDASKASAGMKAFIVNRIGDAAFIIGMFILFMEFKTLNFHELATAIKSLGVAPMWTWSSPIALGTLFLFIGATGKSAQIPLYVWLPDAMAGPTPVSALIHAATMVTAGVYMIVRMGDVFLAAPTTLFVIAIIGGLTALFSATIGIFQNDIKKVLAYSTVSQLGLMFLACGVGAFTAAMFHLMTHAFFKALMFLGSGSVIHGMHEEQDIQKMGGLKKYMPWTHITFFMGWLAIIGLPGFSGFFSKDEILWYSYASPYGSKIFWLLGLLTALCTAFYMTRLMALTFWSPSRFSKDVHPHESSAVMLIPLFVLALLSIFAGWIGVPHVLAEYLGHIPNYLSSWLSPVVTYVKPAVDNHSIELGLMVSSVLLVLVSAFIAFKIYILPKPSENKNSNPIKHLIANKYFIDELYNTTLVNPIISGSKNIWYYFDVNIIDKTTHILSDLVSGASRVVRQVQSGNIQTYAMYIVIGLVVTLSILIAR